MNAVDVSSADEREKLVTSLEGAEVRGERRGQAAYEDDSSLVGPPVKHGAFVNAGRALSFLLAPSIYSQARCAA
jgi:hypothetical protein